MRRVANNHRLVENFWPVNYALRLSFMLKEMSVGHLCEWINN